MSWAEEFLPWISETGRVLSLLKRFRQLGSACAKGSRLDSALCCQQPDFHALLATKRLRQMVVSGESCSAILVEDNLMRGSA